ncbi:hypothetical protein ACJ41O_015026 [Fusarium nematophilum]
MSDFPYQAFTASEDEIRILDLLPGPGPISCRLRNIKLSDKPQYEALSYCWGKSPKTRTIHVNDHPISIGINLYQALQHLRGTAELRSLWTDAICINQTDNDEKSIQVPLMRQIYEQCSRTVIWLGMPNILTRRAFHVLQVLLEFSHAYPLGNPKVEADTWRHAEHNLGLTTGRTAQGDRNLDTNWFWDRILDALAFWFLWKREWFSRVWILQEATVCPDAIVKCGKDEISWTHFIEYYNWNTDFLPLETLGPISSRMSWKRDVPMDLFDAFASNEGSLATNPRDKIYGVLAFVRYKDSINIKVDYSKDPSEIFLDFTRAILKARPNLDVLVRSCGDRPSSKDRLPSWSLSWEIDKSQQLYDFSFTGQGHGLNPPGMSGYNVPGTVEATLDSKPDVTFSDDGKALGLLGASFDEIEAVGHAMPENDDIAPMQVFRAYLSWRGICDLDSASAYEPTGQSRRVVFWRMMKWMTLGDGRTDEAKQTAEFDAFDKTVVRLTSFLPRFLGGIQIGIALLAIWDMYLTAASTAGIYTTDPSWIFDTGAGWGRAMFRTKRGFVGLGPCTLRAGDRVFLVSGSKAPLAFRQYGERWRLVGEVYVHGIMAGEAFDSSKCERMWVE